MLKLITLFSTLKFEVVEEQLVAVWLGVSLKGQSCLIDPVCRDVGSIEETP